MATITVKRLTTLCIECILINNLPIPMDFYGTLINNYVDAKNEYEYKRRMSIVKYLINQSYYHVSR